MKSYVWVTFGLLGLIYYEMSGGADFVPGDRGVKVFARVDPVIVREMSGGAEVTRLALVDAASLGPDPAEFPDRTQIELETAVLTAIRSQEPSTEPAASREEARVAVTLAVAEAVADRPGQDAAPRDLRTVNGSRVNLRDGPGTGFGVLGTLARGTEVEVLEDPGAGWVRLQVVPEGQIGWIADFLLDGA